MTKPGDTKELYKSTYKFQDLSKILDVHLPVQFDKTSSELYNFDVPTEQSEKGEKGGKDTVTFVRRTVLFLHSLIPHCRGTNSWSRKSLYE